MGFDLYALNPSTRKKLEAKEYENVFTDDSSYFRNNVWWWRRLWEFTTTHCGDILNKEDILLGQSNNCHRISKKKALALSKRLDERIEDGTAAQFEADVNAYIEEEEKKEEKARAALFAKHNCKDEDAFRKLIAATTNQEESRKLWDEYHATTSWGASYPFSVKNVRSFAKFCKESGGFEIC